MNSEINHSAKNYRYTSSIGPRYALPIHFSSLADAQKHEAQCKRLLAGLPGQDSMRIETLIDDVWAVVTDE